MKFNPPLKDTKPTAHLNIQSNHNLMLVGFYLGAMHQHLTTSCKRSYPVTFHSSNHNARHVCKHINPL